MQAKARAGRPIRHLGTLVSGLMICVLAVVVTISFMAIVFSGPLAGFLSRGIGLGLFSGLVIGVVAAATTSYRGTIAQPQDVTAVVLGLSAATIAAGMGADDPERLYATVVALIAVASVLMGVAFVLAGTVRVGFVARFIPYPVLGGFLAATGYLITLAGLGMAAGASGLADLATPAAARRWAPAALIGLAMLVALRRTGNGLAVPVVVLLTLGGFYLWLRLAGISLAEAEGLGLMLGPFPEGEGLWSSFHPRMLAQADYRAILGEAPAILTLIGLALIGTILNASGIEVATGRAVDPNRELRGVGLANVIAGAAGGPPGYHIISETLLARQMLGVESRWIGVAVGLASGLVLLAGASVLEKLPVLVFAVVLLTLSLDLLYEWLWVERRRMPLPDFAIVVLILATAATVGFLPAIAVGVLAAAVLFVMTYSRLGVVRARLTAALRRSTTERPEAEARLLAERGAETLIFELQGYVFFGTAHALYTTIAAEIGAPGAPVRRVILDFRRVQGLDVSAVFNFGKLEQLCEQRGVELIVSDLDPKLLRPMQLAGVIGRVRSFDTLDAALAAVEDAVLAEADPAEQGARDRTEIGRLIARAEAGGSPAFPPEQVAAGTVILRQGDPADSLILLERGLLSARVAGPDGGSMRVASFLPETVVGEIGFYAGGLRTATVVAEHDSTIRRIATDDLGRLSERDPALARDLHAAIAAILAGRLTRTTALLQAMSR